ncbi:hypothetical protein BLOT_006953 [Blomia tropicalis]|nr:hypothetical protein BLOT_006953 [Blomia tropicalis]
MITQNADELGKKAPNSIGEDNFFPVNRKQTGKFIFAHVHSTKLKGNFLDIWLLARINFASMHLYTVLNEFKSHYTKERDPNSVPQPDLIITFFITFISSLAISLE